MFQPCAMGRISLESVNEYARRGYAVRVTCEGCGHVVDWNAIALMRELHRLRASMHIEEVERRMKCSSCGERRARIMPAMVEW